MPETMFGLLIQLSSINREDFILGFLDIFPINGTVFNGNIGENIHFILEFQKIFPFNGVPISGIQPYTVQKQQL